MSGVIKLYDVENSINDISLPLAVFETHGAGLSVQFLYINSWHAGQFFANYFVVWLFFAFSFL